jgi:hypothetical protein
MFNYCFPLDYKQQMRVKLENLCQGPNQTVSEYVYDLQELFDLTGDTPPNLQVIKIWYSLQPKIQRTMWKDGLHLDESSWEEVVAKAEMVEIADSVIDYREQIGQTNRSQGTSQQSRNRPQNSGIALRSVSYTPQNRDNNFNNTRNNNSQRQENYQNYQRRQNNNGNHRG